MFAIDHPFALEDERALFLPYNLFKRFRNLGVASRCLRHNEVQKDDHGDHYRDEPQNPKQLVLRAIQFFGCLNQTVVAYTHSECPEDLAKVKPDCIVVFCRGIYLGSRV